MGAFRNRTALDRVADPAPRLGDVDAPGLDFVRDGLERLEMLGMQLARVDAEDAAVAGREDREWQGKDVDPQGRGGLPSLVLTDEDLVVELHVAGELGDEVGFVDGDPDDLEVGPSG